MKRAIHLEHRASSSWSKHEGEPSFALCDRLDRTRDNSQRQLPTDHDYAVPTREYQTDQSSLKPAQAAARSVLGEKQKQRQRQKQPHRLRRVDRVTPYQGLPLTEREGKGAAGQFTTRRRCVNPEHALMLGFAVSTSHTWASANASVVANLSRSFASEPAPMFFFCPVESGC